MKYFHKILLFVGSITMTLLILIIALQVVLRYGFSKGVVWGDDSALVMMMISIFAGAVIAESQKKHLKFDMIVPALPGMWRRILAFVQQLVVTITAAALVYSFYILASHGLKHTSLTLGISLGIIYGILGVLMLCLTITSIYNLFTNN